MEHFLSYSILAGRQMPALESQKKRWSIFNVYTKNRNGAGQLLLNKTATKKMSISEIARQLREN